MAAERGEWMSLGDALARRAPTAGRGGDCNVGWEGWLHLFHVPDQGSRERVLQRTDKPFPRGRWVRITIWLDLGR